MTHTTASHETIVLCIDETMCQHKTRAPAQRPGGRQHAANRDGGAPTCQVLGCTADLSRDKPYSQKRRICSQHMQAEAVYNGGDLRRPLRYCLQHGKLEPLGAFEGTKRSCRLTLEKRRVRLHPAPATPSDAHTAPWTAVPADDASAALATAISASLTAAGCLPGGSGGDGSSSSSGGSAAPGQQVPLPAVQQQQQQQHCDDSDVVFEALLQQILLQELAADMPFTSSGDVDCLGVPPAGVIAAGRREPFCTSMECSSSSGGGGGGGSCSSGGSGLSCGSASFGVLAACLDPQPLPPVPFIAARLAVPAAAGVLQVVQPHNVSAPRPSQRTRLEHLQGQLQAVQQQLAAMHATLRNQ